MDEIQKLEYYDKLFLTAFYYRQVGKADRALEKLNELLKYRPEMSKAKREKILVLKNLQQYEEATILAKENYYQYSDNPYHIQAYFDCLINVYNKIQMMTCCQSFYRGLAKYKVKKHEVCMGVVRHYIWLM